MADSYDFKRRKDSGVREVQTVSRWENGVNSPDVSLIPRIAMYFNVSADFLFEIIEDSRNV